MTLFSIVVPAYNAVDTLNETLDAVLDQTFGDWQCIVVDDGSADGTRDLADEYAQRDPRLSVISQANRGTGGAYNTGVRSATGLWVSVCSADDLLLPAHLEVMARALETNPDRDIFSCNGYYLAPDGARQLAYADEAARAPRSWSLRDVFKRCFFSVGACYRRSLFDSTRGYREGVYGEDYDFWLRAMAGGATHLYIPDALAVHRTSPTQKSANHVRAFESDVMSLQGVLTSGALSWGERRAARAAINARRRMIAEIVAPMRLSNRIRRRLRSLRRRPR